MNGAYKIEKLDYGEIDKLVKLYMICFKREVDANFFKWKYFDNPAGEALCLVARRNGNIAGFAFMMPENFYIFGEKKKIYKYGDLMVHPDHRKKGLATELIFRLCESPEQAASLFSYTITGETSKPILAKNRWIKLDDVDILFKHHIHLRAKFLCTGLDGLYKKGILRPISSIANLCGDYKFDERMDRINVAKDEKYLSWRVSDPRFKYNIIGYYENSIPKGYIIYTHNMGPGDDTWIIDIDTAGCADNRKIVKALISAVESAAFKGYQRAVIMLVAKNSPLHKVMRENSYIYNPFSKGPLASLLDLYVLTNEKYGSKVLNKANWDIYTMHYDGL
jgi:GNAT superfamily N-acetyltransferase